MQNWYAGEVWYAQGSGRRVDPICIQEQAQIERDLSENGAEDSRPLEDVTRQISDVGRADLYEARIIMRDLFYYISTVMHDLWQDWSPWIYAVLITCGLVLIMSMAI